MSGGVAGRHRGGFASATSRPAASKRGFRHRLRRAHAPAAARGARPLRGIHGVLLLSARRLTFDAEHLAAWLVRL